MTDFFQQKFWDEIYFQLSNESDISQLNNAIIVKNTRLGSYTKFQGDFILDILLEFYEEPQSFQSLSNLIVCENLKDILSVLIKTSILEPLYKFHENKNCPCCTSSEYYSILSTFNEQLDIDFKWVKCRTCNCIFLNPSIDRNISRFYYVCLGKYRNSRELLKSDYLSDLTKKACNRKIEIIKSYLNNIDQKKILDVGCGDGDILVRLFKQGANVTGLDIDEIQIDKNKETNQNVSWLCNDFYSQNFSDYKFDLITMWSYLEHEHRQKEVISKAHKILNGNGYLIIEIPNYSGLLRKVFGKFWPFYDPPFHVVHHSKNSIIYLLKSQNFEIRKILEFGTSPFYFKYSAIILSLMVMFKISYNSTLLDYFITTISKKLVPIEECTGLSSKMVVIAKKH